MQNVEIVKPGRMVVVFLVLVCICVSTQAVTSQVVRHREVGDFSPGQTESIVVGSRGTLQLGFDSTEVVEELSQAWSVNAIVVNAGAVFMGTSPNGCIYKYSLGQLSRIYPAETGDADANEAQEQAHLTNEHIFAMGTDLSGRLLVGISGERCRLLRADGPQLKTIYEPNDAKYIFAIEVASDGDIYLGTGPEGKIYRLDSFGKKGQLVYDCEDDNILSLAIGEDGNVYAGSDGRGVVYKIDPASGRGKIIYDSEQEEITSLLFSDGNLFAAATSAQLVAQEADFGEAAVPAGRPPSKPDSSNNEASGGLNLKIANTSKGQSKSSPKARRPSRPGGKPDQASFIYKIDPEGFVRDVFSEKLVMFAMAQKDQRLLVGTGNRGRLFSITPALEQVKKLYEDEQSSQITAVEVAGDGVYLGMANPAKVIKLSDKYAKEGTFESKLVDASQPAKWGNLQIEADIPEGCRVLVSSRSGNVKDVNSATFSDWTEPVVVTKPVELRCPMGRFCQYKLILTSSNQDQTPVIREVALAHIVPNLAPDVESVKVSREEKKQGFFKVEYQTKDRNNDELVYKLAFRKTDWAKWIELKDEVKSNDFQWDSRTVEDGRYVIKVTACDRKSNTTDTALTDSRISDPVVVDNTGPVFARSSIKKDSGKVILNVVVRDVLSMIDKLDYTVDSSEDWQGTLPEDSVYDTSTESLRIIVEDLEPGEHVISLRVADAVGNVTYKSFVVTVSD